jgi:sodium-dependent dicarboxylate transporter 2/3/5
MNEKPPRAGLRQKLGLVTGLPIFFFFLLFPISGSITPAAQKTLAVAVLMAWWWITEALPIPATSLIPIVAFPVLHILSGKEIARSYGDSNIFLFMGGFFLAISMQRWELHKRIALHIIKFIGMGPRNIILGFMVATAFLSMWISNTATTMMMYPIGLAVILQISSFKDENGKELQSGLVSSFRVALMLGIAYAASIGGIGTKIGTPPNIVFAATLKSLFPNAPEIGFLQWMVVGVPLVVIFTPIAWLYLTRIALPVRIKRLHGGREIIENEIAKLGPMSKAECYVFAIFILTALLWIFRKNIELEAFTIPGWSNLLGISNMVNDATVAVFSALLLFAVPVNFKERTFLLDWESAVKIPWGILLLFGGGIALAAGFKASGLAVWLGGQLGAFSHVPLIAMIMIICCMAMLLTELTSNTATTTILMPILAATSLAIGMHPFLLMIPATISASCAFMLPVATPPNAIVFGSGYITIPQMARTGVGLNLIGVFIVTLIVYLIAVPAFGIILGSMPSWIH